MKFEVGDTIINDNKQEYEIVKVSYLGLGYLIKNVKYGTTFGIDTKNEFRLTIKSKKKRIFKKELEKIIK